jgi:hypothetical protein
MSEIRPWNEVAALLAERNGLHAAAATSRTRIDLDES